MNLESRKATDRSADASPSVAGAAAPRTGPQASGWATATATFFGIGRLRPGPGTWASAATTVFWWILIRWIPLNWHVVWLTALVILTTAIGIPAATRVARASGIKDPSFVVIDEVVGQLVTFIAIPVSWKSLLLGFILFRGFDIVKPPPVRQLEHLPDGAGIVLDDVGAGVYALIVMHILLYAGIFPR